MKKVFMITGLTLLIFTSAFAQGKTAGDLSVQLGVLSWEEIQSPSKEKPAEHTEEFHRNMAKSMLKMHSGNVKGSYHIMVMVSDKSTGKDIKNAEVVVSAVSKAGPAEITQKLEPMNMDGFNGYGEFFKLKLKGPYIFKVNIKTYSRTYNVELERTIL